MLSCYLNLKHNCKRRKKYFALTFEEFEMLCVETNYLQGRGITKVSYTIDCIDNEAGYFLLNIRVIPKSENSKKGTKALVYDWQTGYATAIKLFEKVQMEREEDMPF